MATGLKPVTERTVDGNPILNQADEQVMHVQPRVSIALGNHPLVSPGTLHITSKRIVWLSDTEIEKGFAVDFVSVSLHAVSRDAEAYPSPCIYAQIETGAEDDEQEDSDSDSDETLNLSKITEMRLVPSDPSQLDTLFAIFCECAELNPDPVEAEEEGGNNWFFSADQLDGECGDDGDLEWPVFQNPNHTIGANGHDLASSVLHLQINDQRFEDADEMEQEDKNGTADQHMG